MIKKGTQGKNLNTIPYIRESKFLRKSTMGDYRFFINWLQKGRLNSKPGEQNNIPV